MIAATKSQFEAVLRQMPPPTSVLDVGALPSESSLLTCAALADVPLRVGVNLMESGSIGAVPVVRMDARRLAFGNGVFDLVVSSSTLEHVPDFWRACEEMKRVLAPGGTLIVSTPGLADSRYGRFARRLAFRFGLPDIAKRSTITMRIHDAPYDYYRFTEYAYRDVILAGLQDVHIWHSMTPPRLFGMARKSVDREFA